jgi:hypothetical protein
MRLFHFLASEEHKEDIQASSVVKQSPPHFTYPLSVINHTLPPIGLEPSPSNEHEAHIQLH